MRVHGSSNDHRGIRNFSNPGFAVNLAPPSLHAYCCTVLPALRLRHFQITPRAHPFLHAMGSTTPMIALRLPLSLRMTQMSSAALMCPQ